jgi:hypothetical protein
LLGIPILSESTGGITFDLKAQLTVPVSRSFAELYFPGRSAIGQYLSEASYPVKLQIVGVVSDIPEHGHVQDPKPTVYWCGVPYSPDPEYIRRRNATCCRFPTRFASGSIPSNPIARCTM